MVRLLRKGGRGLIYVWSFEFQKQKYPSQEAYVPWHLSAAVKPGAPLPAHSKVENGEIVLCRYYHLFVKGELEDLIIKDTGEKEEPSCSSFASSSPSSSTYDDKLIHPQLPLPKTPGQKPSSSPLSSPSPSPSPSASPLFTSSPSPASSAKQAPPPSSEVIESLSFLPSHQPTSLSAMDFSSIPLGSLVRIIRSGFDHDNWFCEIERIS